MDALTELREYFTALGDAVPPDPVLTLQLRRARSYIQATCNRQVWDETDERLADAQLRLALQYCNQMGIEGQTAHSEGGVSRSFAPLPEDLAALLESLRLAPRVQRPEKGG